MQCSPHRYQKCSAAILKVKECFSEYFLALCHWKEGGRVPPSRHPTKILPENNGKISVTIEIYIEIDLAPSQKVSEESQFLAAINYSLPRETCYSITARVITTVLNLDRSIDL